MRVSSLLSATLESGVAVEERPKRDSDSEDLPLGEPERERIPERVLEREPKSEGLAGRSGRLEGDVSGDSLAATDLVLGMASVGREESVGGWPALPSPCEVMYRNRVLSRWRISVTRALST